MSKKANGAGTIYQRGSIWWVKIYVDGRPVYESSESEKKSDAIKLRDKMLAKRHRGEISGGAPDRVLITELIDDVLKSDIEETTRYIWTKVVEKNVRPFFGRIRAARLTTDLMDQYRDKRKGQGVSDATVNRELSILRTAYHNARKRTPPKVNNVPYFPMVKETNIRTGFLTDEQFEKVRDEMPSELKALFVCDYLIGIRRSELLALEWWQVDFEQGLICLDKTKNDDPRTVPIIPGDMEDLLKAAYEERQRLWPDCPWVFARAGKQIKGFRDSWKQATARAGVPDLLLHDLRRTAVRNMRNAGVPQVIRMKISGHKTDSMERRYNIVDLEDIRDARELMAARFQRSVTAQTA